MKIQSTQSDIHSQLKLIDDGAPSRGDFRAILNSFTPMGDDSSGLRAPGTSQQQAHGSVDAVHKTAAQKLAEYLQKSPAEHMRDAILRGMGLTEEDLDAMPPEKREAVENEIARRIVEKLEQAAGRLHNGAQPPFTATLSDFLHKQSPQVAQTGEATPVAGATAYGNPEKNSQTGK